MVRADDQSNVHAITTASATEGSQLRDGLHQLVVQPEEEVQDVVESGGDQSGDVCRKSRPARTKGIVMRHAGEQRKEELVFEASDLQAAKVTDKGFGQSLLIRAAKLGELLLEKLLVEVVGRVRVPELRHIASQIVVKVHETSRMAEPRIPTRNLGEPRTRATSGRIAGNGQVPRVDVVARPINTPRNWNRTLPVGKTTPVRATTITVVSTTAMMDTASGTTTRARYMIRQVRNTSRRRRALGRCIISMIGLQVPPANSPTGSHPGRMRNVSVLHIALILVLERTDRGRCLRANGINKAADSGIGFKLRCGILKSARGSLNSLGDRWRRRRTVRGRDGVGVGGNAR
jgi:hypothetical protein